MCRGVTLGVLRALALMVKCTLTGRARFHLRTKLDAEEASPYGAGDLLVWNQTSLHHHMIQTLLNHNT